LLWSLLQGASALQQLQQQQLQKQLLAQQMLLQQQVHCWHAARLVHHAVFACLAHCNLGPQALTGGNLSLSNKKQREIYVGNLTIGVVVDTMLRDLFNGALAHLVPDPVANPPVINAALDPSGVTTLFASCTQPGQFAQIWSSTQVRLLHLHVVTNSCSLERRHFLAGTVVAARSYV